MQFPHQKTPSKLYKFQCFGDLHSRVFAILTYGVAKTRHKISEALTELMYVFIFNY
jgi:hypothetical protein